MEQKRFFLFLILSMTILIGWTNFVAPLFFGQPAVVNNDDADKEPQQDKGRKNKDGEGKDAKLTAADADQAQAPAVARKPDDVDSVVVQQPPKKTADAPKQVRHPHKTVHLGSLDPDTGFFLYVTLDSRGASVGRIELTDPRYKQVKNRKKSLEVVKTVTVEDNKVKTDYRTLALFLEQLGSDAATLPLDRLNWKVVKKSPTAATFRIVTDDGKIELTKTYRLKPVKKKDAKLKSARNTDTAGYELGFDLTIKNLTSDKLDVRYTLQGPTGLPLEDAKTSNVHRGIKVGYWKGGEVTFEPKTAGEVVGEVDEVIEGENGREIGLREINARLGAWQSPIRYIGVDVQYFAALLVPADQTKTSYFDQTRPMLLNRTGESAHSDISVQMRSAEIALAAGKEIKHSFSLYAGPKREVLLEPFDAVPVMEFSTWFGIGYVSKGMLKLLTFLHGLGIPFGIAIIILTVIVRGCMFPISRKQAVGAKKMKELQPKIAELRKKYEGDKEKMAKAQMELFSKNNYNPFAGCLPIFLQLPIFIGLYRALGSAVDLRMARFLWADNLAAPDALFTLPFALPFLGNTFNLLPIITIFLFIAQQKLFMPPATNPEEEMRNKMMSYMMIFMGFLFYKFPAGLCVYFIASSLWGMGERKMLDYGKSAAKTEGDADEKKNDNGESRQSGVKRRESSNGSSARKEGRSDNSASKKKRKKTKSKR